MNRKSCEIVTRQPYSFPKEIIKPSYPTPSHLGHYNLSLLDQFMFPHYIPIVLYFPNNRMKSTEISYQLKLSLSKTLSLYYPFAGRLNSQTYVDCNDEGIEFQESRINFKLNDILKNQNHCVAPEWVFPLGLKESGFRHDSNLMVVKLTHFDCGGIAIAVCLSHKVADACTSFAFLKCWAKLTCQSLLNHVLPNFMAPLPSRNVIVKENVHQKHYLVTRRFVFHNSKIADLKAAVSSSAVQNPTRFEVLAALLYKCAITASKSSLGFFSPSIFLSAVNMRPKMVQANTSFGNFSWRMLVQTTNEKALNLNSLAEEINKAKNQVGSTLNVVVMEDAVSTMNKLIECNYKVYFFTSLCNFGMYKVDFGWGKPVRVMQALPLFHSSIIFMDTPSGDGIEALVSMEEEDMAHFELDKELLSYASLY